MQAFILKSIHFGLISSLLASLTLAACAVNPVTGKKELAWISEAQQIAIGQQQYAPSQQSQGGLYLADAEISAYINQVGQAVARFAGANLAYEFVLLNNSAPNAWALPGGKIAVNRGLLFELKNEAELAAVLGHEVVHAAARHGAKAIERATITQGLVSATAMIISRSEYKNYADYVVGSARIGAQLISFKYGRKAELEADYYGIQYMHQAGYAAAAAISLQETFVRLSKGRQSSRLERLFSSHPPSLERLQTNRGTVNALGKADGNLFAGRFEQKIAHLRKTKPAYDKLDLAVSLASIGEYVPALSALTQASQLEPKEAKFYGMKGKIYYQMKDYPRSEAAFGQALRLDNQYFEYYLGRGLTRCKLGKADRARQDLQKSNQWLPTAVANKTLGEMALTVGNRQAAKRYFQVAMDAPGAVGESARLAFSRLDIEDNPDKYITAALKATDRGELVVIVSNKSMLDMKKVDLAVSAILGQKSVGRQLSIVDLAAYQRQQVALGWTLNDARVQEVRFRITDLALQQEHKDSHDDMCVYSR